MKKYITPIAEVVSAEVQNLMAVSLKVSNTEVSGDEALVKEESAGWEIWND